MHPLDAHPAAPLTTIRPEGDEVMADVIDIEGWMCRVVRGQRSAQNYAAEIGAWLLPDGRLKTEGLETDGSSVTVTVPSAVLAWLVAPLLVRPGWVPVLPDHPHAGSKETP